MGLAVVPNGALIYLLLRLGLFMLLNAVPEMIYQGRASGLELIGASYNFIVENWIEWLVPNLILFAAGYFFLDFFESLLFGLPAFVQLFLIRFHDWASAGLLHDLSRVSFQPACTAPPGARGFTVTMPRS